MSDERARKTKTLQDHLKDLVNDAVGALERLLSPPPQLVPIPTRRRPRRRR